MQYAWAKTEVYMQHSWEIEGKRSLGRTRHTSEDNSKIDLQGM
jgi:hypothetical protein